MRVSVRVSVLLQLLHVVIGQEEKVDYYVNLINRHMEAAHDFQAPKSARMYEPRKSEVRDYGTYDFIVVGAGAAGCVIANRLSAISQWRVLLIEAGYFEDDFTDIPAMYTYDQFSRYNWAYTSVPQTSCCLGMVDRRCPYPRGKAVGGTTVINGLVVTRGSHVDYERWASLGNPDWDYKNVLPDFISLENSQVNGDPGFRGVGGLMNTEFYSSPNEQLFAFLEANREIGYEVRDYNGYSEIGASPTQLNTVFGRRMSTGKAFIKPAIHRENLHVLTESYVTRILIHSENNTAYGVTFSNSSTHFRAYASKEVIVSAGAIESPHLLLLSGIGPRGHLQEKGINVIQDLPGVGKNLLDHPNFLGLNFETNYVQPVKPVREYVIEYLNGTGPYTVPGSNQGLGFYRLNSSFPLGLPDIELMMIPANNTDPLTARGLRLTDATAEAVYHNMNRISSFTLFVVALHCLSSGTVTLKSSDPYDYPLIDSRYFENPADVDTMYEGIQFVLKLVETEAFRGLNATLVGTNAPGCENYTYASKDYFYCAIRHVSIDLYHPVGTCRMGPNPESGAVVNQKLKVHGVNNVRVADASIFPTTLSAHPAVPTMMIGEKVSKFLIAHYLFGETDM